MTTTAKRYSAITTCALLMGAALASSPNTAHADRKGMLDDVPAVRHRLLMVKKRFEFSLTSEATINSDFRHTLGAGLKLEYHVSDLLSFGVIGIVGTSINTGLTDKIIDTLPTGDGDRPMGDPTPTKDEFKAHLNKMPLHGAAFLAVTPWYGKLAAFGKFFVNFDFYFQGGLAFASLKANCSTALCSDQFAGGGIDSDGNVRLNDDKPYNDPVLNSGFEPGLYLGGGIHVFINDYIALDLTVRDYIFKDNPSGLDFNADLAVTDDDNRFLNHLFMGVGISILLPTSVERTN